jgi:hypothetical protein
MTPTADIRLNQWLDLSSCFCNKRASVMVMPLSEVLLNTR